MPQGFRIKEDSLHIFWNPSPLTLRRIPKNVRSAGEPAPRSTQPFLPMAFAIMRTAKLTSAGSIGGLNNHLERKMEVPNADQQLQGYNSRPVGSGDLWADINTRLQQAGIEKVRTNGVYGVEFLLTASPEAFNYQKTVDTSGKVGLRGNVELWKNFEARSKEWLEENFGKANLVNFTVHKDEQTPHIHAVIVPITEGKKGNKLSARDVIGGDRSRLAQLQDSFAKKMEPLGLQRGVEKSKARHVAIREYYGVAKEVSKGSIDYHPALDLPKVPQLEFKPPTVLQRTTDMTGYLKELKERTEKAVAAFLEAERQMMQDKYEKSLRAAEKRLKSDNLSNAATVLRERGNRRHTSAEAKLATIERVLDAQGLKMKFTPDGKSVQFEKKTEPIQKMDQKQEKTEQKRKGMRM